MLIATLPPIYREGLLKFIFSDPAIEAVRYNTGMVSQFTVKETLEALIYLSRQYSKKLLIDLKGRQLRITRWAAPNYGKILLNHDVEVDGPARVFFRGNEFSELRFAVKNVIFVDPPPRQAVGEGQAINILGENVKIHGYLTEQDKEFVKEGAKLGITDFCLSFVECQEDIHEVEDLLAESTNLAMLWLKIESPKGFEFVSKFSPGELDVCNYRLVAARDDWFVTQGNNKAQLLDMLKRLVQIDPEAVVASRLFSGLEKEGQVQLADYSDLELMRLFGYKHFMLSDGVCQQCFEQAIAAWTDFQKGRLNG